MKTINFPFFAALVAASITLLGCNKKVEEEPITSFDVYQYITEAEEDGKVNYQLYANALMSAAAVDTIVLTAPDGEQHGLKEATSTLYSLYEYLSPSQDTSFIKGDYTIVVELEDKSKSSASDKLYYDGLLPTTITSCEYVEETEPSIRIDFEAQDSADSHEVYLINSNNKILYSSALIGKLSASETDLTIGESRFDSSIPLIDGEEITLQINAIDFQGNTYSYRNEMSTVKRKLIWGVVGE